MLCSTEALSIGMEMLKVWDFYLPAHTQIFDAMCEQYHEGKSVDEIVLANRLTLSDIPSPETFIGNLIVDVPSAASIESYCTVLRAWTKKRREFEAAGHLIDGNSEQAIEVLNKADTGDSSVSAGMSDLEKQFEDEISGKRIALALPNWPVLSRTQILGPGTISLICGSPGVSKSFFALEPVWEIHFEGHVKSTIMELESGPKFHCRRSLAQMSGCSQITNIQWVKDNPSDVRDLCNQYRGVMDDMRKVIFAPAPGQRPTCEFLLSWMRRMSDKGYRLLAIDPITIMAGKDLRFLDHERFAEGARSIVEKYDNSLLMVIHPKDSNSELAPSMDNLPCSKIWERTCSGGIVWLEYHAAMTAKFADAKTLFPSSTGLLPYNRTLHTLKVRSAENPGRIAYWFNKETLRHEERGILTSI